MTALAGLVPWAEAGISTTSRSRSPRARWNARIASSPANSPCAPELGCRETASKPVTAHSSVSSSATTARYPPACEAGAKGCTSPNSGQVTGSISAAALSFIVHEPRGIIDVSRPTSLRSSRFR